MALTAWDEAIADRDEVRSFADGLTGHAQEVIHSQEGIFRSAVELLRRADTLE